MHNDHFRRRNNERHRREALERIVGHFRPDDGLNDHVLVRDQDRGAVGRCVGRLPGRNCTAGACRVLNEEIAAEPLGELLHQDARDNVVWATRCIRYDQLDRLRRISLRNAGALPRGDAKQG